MPTEQLEKIIPLLKNSGAEYAGVFGSFARGEDHPGSDIDILARFHKPLSLLAYIHLENQLSDALGKKVDLVSEAALHPMVKPFALKDLQIFYGQR